MSGGIAPIIYYFTISLILLCKVRGKLNYEQRAVIDIKVDKGQVYDCVDFYKQLAFSHPSVKNLDGKVRPSIPDQGHKRRDFGLPDGGCPYGTVPILRTGTPDEREPPPPPPPPKPQEHCSAVVRTNDADKKFLGASGSISLYKPEVHNSQWSTSRVKLINGPDSIEAGWMVNPDLFKDQESHLYARFNTAGQGGCINTQCPGFVQVDTLVPLGFIPKHYSAINGPQYLWDISIVKNADDGNWWLVIGKDQVRVGYWPKSLFSSLTNVATEAQWGGEINNPGPTNPAPNMGNSLQASYDTRFSAFIRYVTVDDQGSHGINPENTVKYWNCLDRSLW